MLLLRLWNYLRGYVIIVVEGYFLEKFINICIHRQIFLWDIKRQKSSLMTLKISIKGFKSIKPVARKTNCRVKIVRKKGLPFILNRYKRRKTFLIGAGIFILLFYIMTSFIWAVEVSGNKEMDSKEIISILQEYGVKPGVLKYGIDTDKIVSGMMMDIKELAWISVSVKGTKVKVDMVERKKPPEIVPVDKPCDIIASKDGLIKSAVTMEGEQIVNPGETVSKGQLLISGTITSKNTDIPPKQVHAMGTVKARTWYEKSCPVETVVTEKVSTGNMKNNYSLVLFSKRINLFHGKISFADYEKEQIKKQLSIGKDMALPFELIIDRYSENKTNKKNISLSQAKENARQEAYKAASKDIPKEARIISWNTNFEQNGQGKMIAVVTIECEEDIGVTKEIGGS